MPRGDGTGPMGTGSTSGRRAGFCAGYGAPGFANPMPRRGLGFRGGRRGFRHMFYATGLPGWQRFGYTPPTPQQESDVLKAQAESLKQELDAINKRIADLEGKA
ncbi:MAG: DUF5320 domain-containing protein [Anaerolineales bacterium]|nr:DUF5320 domain-containing protein [Anaerolineales bacterium]